MALPGVPDQHQGHREHHPQQGATGEVGHGETCRTRKECSAASSATKQRNSRAPQARRDQAAQAPGMAAQDAPPWSQTCRRRAMALQGLQRIGRAGRLEAAAAAQPRTQQQAGSRAPGPSAGAAAGGHATGGVARSWRSGGARLGRTSCRQFRGAPRRQASEAATNGAGRTARRRTTHRPAGASPPPCRRRYGSAASAAKRVTERRAHGAGHHRASPNHRSGTGPCARVIHNGTCPEGFHVDNRTELGQMPPRRRAGHAGGEPRRRCETRLAAGSAGNRPSARRRPSMRRRPGAMS